MSAKRDALAEYIPAVFSEAWGLGFGLVAGVIGVVALTVTGIQVAWWEWIIIAFACLSPAQFMAYFRARERYRGEAHQTQTTTNIQTQINYYASPPPAAAAALPPDPAPVPPQALPPPAAPGQGEAGDPPVEGGN